MEQWQRYENEIFTLRSDKKRLKLEVDNFSRQQNMEGEFKYIISYRFSKNYW